MKKPKNGKTMLAAMPQDAQAAARRLAKKHGTTPAEEVARVCASMERVCRRGNAERDIGVPKATPAQVRKAVRKLAKVRGCSAAQVLADERKAHARASGRGKLYHADIMGKGVVTDRRKLDAKHGRAAAECLAQMYAAELQREQEAHAQTAAEAAADVATLAQQVATAQMWQRYERRKRRKVEQGLTFVATQAAAAQAAQAAQAERLMTSAEAREELERRCGKMSDRTFWKYVKDGRCGIERVRREGMRVLFRFVPKQTT